MGNRCRVGSDYRVRSQANPPLSKLPGRVKRRSPRASGREDSSRVWRSSMTLESEEARAAGPRG